MSPINHFLSGWLLASSISNLTMTERRLISFSAVIADIDGLGIIAEVMTRDMTTPLLWWSSYHHVLAHNLLFALILAIAVLRFNHPQRWFVALLVFVSFHLHLIEDILSGRAGNGDVWGIQYLYPFSDQIWLWQGQWQLNAWPNLVVAIGLISITCYLAWKRAYSPLAMFSKKIDQHFISALHQRFGKP